jgi:hypothetical protein
MLYERKGGYWRLTFTFRGKRHFLAFGRVTREEAERQAAAAMDLLRRVRGGELELPQGMGIATYLFLGGVTPEEYRQTQELNTLPRRWFDEPHRDPA